MKKLFALLVAMMMAFSCVPALAEETTGQPAMIPDFQLPSFTLNYTVDLDEEQVLALMAATGATEEDTAMMKMLLPLFKGMSETVIFANNGLQYDLKIKEQDVLSLVAEATEKGFALASNLLPSYVLTIQMDTITKLVEDFMKQAQETAGKLDMEQLQKAAEKFVTYSMELMGVYQSKVSFGEPVKGEYADLIEGVVFNTEVPLAVDVKGMMEGQKEFMTKVFTDEDIKGAIDSIVAMIPGASFNAEEIIASMDAPEEYLPEVNGLVYTITDDEGNQTAPNTYVVVSGVNEQHPEGNTNTYVYVAESSLDIIVEVPSQEVSIEVYGELVETGVSANIAVTVPGLDVEIAGLLGMTENGFTLDEAVYVNGAENPLAVCTYDFAMAGERTKSAFDGEKAELPLEGLLNEESAADVIGALTMDAMINGVGTVLNNIKTVLPEQGAVLEQLVGQLMSQFMGGGADEAPVAEEIPAA